MSAEPSHASKSHITSRALGQRTVAMARRAFATGALALVVLVGACANNPERLPELDRRFYYNLDASSDREAFLRLRDEDRQGFLEQRGLWQKWAALPEDQRARAAQGEVEVGFAEFAVFMAWGPPAENFLIRGTPYNMGTVLKLLLAQGARQVGDATQGHYVAIDARSPRFDGGIVTRVDAVSLGIVVNRDAQRFYDEGEDFWPKRYAIWGRLVAGQPGQIAYSIIDAKSMGKFMPPVFPPEKAASIGELAARLGLDAAALERTVAAFNAAVRPGTFDHTVQDDCRTEGLAPPKTHWARRIDTPPFYAYPLRPGLTFTYLGVGVDERARLLLADGRAAANAWAAGEIMAGNVLGKGYLAGIGMAIGTTFGRIAGEEAARHVRP